MDSKPIDRRAFIGSAGLGVLAARLGAPSTPGPTPSQPQPAGMTSRVLGRTNLKIPLVSFGVMNSDNPALLQKALDLGINHLDTANVYLQGNSERVIGEVVKAKGLRDKVYIATKMRFAREPEKNVFLTESTGRELGATPENFDKQLAESLGRLQTDYVDVLYLHSCYGPQMATYEPMMKALVKAREAGKARFIGVSTHKDEPNVIRAAVDAGIYDVVLTAYNYLQKHRDGVRSSIQYATSKGVGVVAMKVFGGSRLTEELSIEINHLAALKWVLNDPSVCTVIPGMTSFAQLDLNLKVMADLALTDSEKRELQLASMLPGTLYCQNCRSCVASCPQRVEIPVLMRAYMYAQGYGNIAQAETTAAQLPPHKGLETCLACPSCTAVCATGKDIAGRMRKLAAACRGIAV